MTQFQLIMLALDASERLARMVVGMILQARQRAELTAEQETVLHTRQRQVMAQHHWQLEQDPK